MTQLRLNEMETINKNINDEYILSKFWKGKHSTLKRFKNKLDEAVIKYLLNRWNDCDDIYESIYRIKYQIIEIPICPICKNKIKFKNNSYNQFCSKACANKNPELIKHRNETMLKNYGCISPCKNEEIKEKLKDSLKNVDWNLRNEKTKNTLLKKYGNEQYINSKLISEKLKAKTKEENKIINEKRKNTCLERYNNPNYRNIEQQQETNLKKYGRKCSMINYTGYTNPEKRKETNNKKYGGNSPTCSDEIKEKIKNTCLEKYGVVSVLSINRNINNRCHTPEIRKKAIQTSIEKFGENNINNREAAKQTCIERYGVSNKRKLLNERKKFGEIMSSENVQEKRNNTLKENGTFNSSQPEKDTFEILKSKFPDTLVQYRDERYPFNCDFYIPNLDLFIECQYSWTHGGHPYNKENDKEKLELWESKNTQYYKNAINTWTVRDVKKRETAKQNNINYLEFFNIKEFNEWFENQ